MASSLVIAPSLGHSIAFAQGMPGGYDAIDDRAALSVGLQEGAVEAGAYKVTERGAGANMTVDVAANAGHCCVQGDSVTSQGLYVVRAHPTVANLDIATAHATLPRVDTVVLDIDDTAHDASGNTRARVMVLTGTATSGATLDNRSGAPALPASAMLLADVHVPAADTSITNSQIRDRRQWARGAFKSIVYTTADTGTLTSTSWAEPFGAGATTITVECSGAPLIARISGAAAAGATNGTIGVGVSVDGDLTGTGTGTRTRFITPAGNGLGVFLSTSFLVTLAAGRHTFSVVTRALSGGYIVRGSTSNGGFEFSVCEFVRQNTDNS